MSIALQADSVNPQGYILINGTAAATVRQDGTMIVPTLSATGPIYNNLGIDLSQYSIIASIIFG